MRSLILVVFTAVVVLLAGCSSAQQVSLGAHGATSPAESGQHGAYGDQAGPSSGEANNPEYQIKPIEEPLTNDFADPSMEGSGNIAAQGDYKQVVAAQQKLPAPPVE